MVRTVEVDVACVVLGVGAAVIYGGTYVVPSRGRQIGTLFVVDNGIKNTKCSNVLVHTYSTSISSLL